MVQSIRRRIGQVVRPDSGMLWGATVLLLLFAALAIQPIQPADFWWHLTVGEVVLEQGQVPRADLFSYTLSQDEPFLYQSWLAGVIFALVHRLGGPAAIVFFNAVLITLAYGLVWRACYWRSGHPHVATACTFAAILVSAGNWGVRPQTFSTLLCALFLLLLVHARQGNPLLPWLLPPLTALWANLHGAFILGPALVGAVFAGETLKTLLPGRPFLPLPLRTRLSLGAATLLSLAAPLLNPAGWRIFSYLQAIQGNPVIRQAMAEWRPPRPDDAIGAVFFLSLLGLFLFLLYQRHRPDPAEALWLTGTTWLALGGVRSILWYSFVAAVVLAGGLSLLRRSSVGLGSSSTAGTRGAGRWQTRMNRLILSIMVGLAVLCLPWCKGILPLPPSLQGSISPGTPVGATDFVVRQGLQGPIFHRMEYGSYLLWRFYPERRVFIDSRVELYPVSQWEDYGRISAGAPEAEALLEAYGVEILLLDRHVQAGLLAHLQGQESWQVVYESAAEGSIVLTRTN